MLQTLALAPGRYERGTPHGGIYPACFRRLIQTLIWKCWKSN